MTMRAKIKSPGKQTENMISIQLVVSNRFLGSLTAEERLELEKKKVGPEAIAIDGSGRRQNEAGQKQYAKAFIEKEKRDQWEQNRDKSNFVF